MKKRLLFAICIGAIAFLRTAEELWYRTKMDLPGIVFWSMTAYFAGIVAVYAVTEKYMINIRRKKVKYGVQKMYGRRESDIAC